MQPACWTGDWRQGRGRYCRGLEEGSLLEGPRCQEWREGFWVFFFPLSSSGKGLSIQTEQGGGHGSRRGHD